MTIVVVVEKLAELIREAVREYDTEQKAGRVPITVYAGFPHVPDTSEEKASFIYCKVASFKDEINGSFGTAEVDIGFSICDRDKKDGWRQLYNLMEHVRQCLLKNPYIGGGTNHLELPLKGEIYDEQPYPQWQGMIHATYTIDQPEQELDFSGMQEVRTDG